MTFTANYAAVEPERSVIDGLKEPTLLEFGAPWCPICRGAQSAIESALRAHPNVKHLKIEDGSGRPLGRAFRVKLWPTLIFLRDGAEIARLVRPSEADVIAKELGRLDA